MNSDERVHLLAERGTLQQILAEIPADDALDRMSFEARLEDVERQLSAGSLDTREPARARVVFRGAPVIGGHGVRADFGARAIQEFVEAVVAIAAAQAGPLSQFGPIPNRHQHQLLITGTTVGSFGFQLEEAPGDQAQAPLPLGETSVASALAQTQQLLQRVHGADDEALADTVELTQPRVRDAVRAFLQTLAAHDAGCTVAYKDAAVTFADGDAVRRSLHRLDEENLHQSTLTVQGAFQGFLPQRRAFEFRRADRDDALNGRVGSAVAEPDVINQHLGQVVEVTLTVLQVGQGQPRYILNQLPAWPDSERSGGEEGARSWTADG